jgi:hypothetical protein
MFKTRRVGHAVPRGQPGGNRRLQQSQWTRQRGAGVSPATANAVSAQSTALRHDRSLRRQPPTHRRRPSRVHVLR